VGARHQPEQHQAPGTRLSSVRVVVTSQGRKRSIAKWAAGERNGKPKSAGLWETVPGHGSFAGAFSPMEIFVGSGNAGPVVRLQLRALEQQGNDVRRADSGMRCGLAELKGPHGPVSFSLRLAERVSEAWNSCQRGMGALALLADLVRSVGLVRPR